MIIEIGRTLYYIASISAYEPFIFTGKVKSWAYPSVWGETCGDAIIKTGKKTRVLTATRDYFNRYKFVYTYAECKTTYGTAYFNKSEQTVYFNVGKEYGFTSFYDYLYAFGVTDSELVYVDDIEYLPLMKETPDINRETDYTNSDQPTGSTGSIILMNQETDNGDGVKYGRLDFLIDEPIYGNDVYFYRLIDGVLSSLGAKYIDDITIGMDEVELSLQDRRFS